MSRPAPSFSPRAVAPGSAAARPAAFEGAGMEVAFPFRVAAGGRVAVTDYPSHVMQMIEQVLFTSPGERVNRPDFGCGLQELVFAPDNEALVTATQFLTLGSLQRWLGSVIQVEAVTVQADDSTLAVTVQYVLRDTGTRRLDTFRRAGRA